MAPANIQKWFPWTKSPLICNGPMLNVVTPKLASEVSKAGGLGKNARKPHTHTHIFTARFFLDQRAPPLIFLCRPRRLPRIRL